MDHSSILLAYSAYPAVLAALAPRIRFSLHKEFRDGEIRLYLHKEFRAAEIRFYLHKEFRAAGIRIFATQRIGGADLQENGHFL